MRQQPGRGDGEKDRADPPSGEAHLEKTGGTEEQSNGQVLLLKRSKI